MTDKVFERPEGRFTFEEARDLLYDITHAHELIGDPPRMQQTAKVIDCMYRFGPRELAILRFAHWVFAKLCGLEHHVRALIRTGGR